MNISQRKKFTQALIEYSPDVLARHLRRATDGTVYYDRQSSVHSKEDESKFFYVLNRDYLSGYQDIENMTVFFDIEGDTIIGGAYNLISGERTSKRRLISDNISTPYTYTKEDIEKFKNILNNA